MDAKLIHSIKDFFKEKFLKITIESDFEEFDYLISSSENLNQIKENSTAKKLVTFTANEFGDFVKATI